MLKVKLSIPGQSPNSKLDKFIGRPDNNVDNCRFYINMDVENPDYWFVLENVYKNEEVCFIDPSKVIYLNYETSYPKDYFSTQYMKNYLSQFSHKYGCYDDFSKNYTLTPPFIPWMINSNQGGSWFNIDAIDFEYLKNFDRRDKTNTISMICSSKKITDDHRVRLLFAEKIAEYFGSDIDWFGDGVNTIENKWDAVSNYKYHIVLENESRNFLISEKLYDSYLGLAFPFYYGGSNVNSFFSKDTYRFIDVLDVKKSIEVIEKGIKENLFEKNYELIKQSRNLVIEKYNLFKRISEIVNNLEENSKSEIKERVSIKSVNYFWNRDVNYKNKIKHFLKRKLRINVNNY